MYWDFNDLFGWAMWQNVRVSVFIWAENRSKFNEDFIQTTMKIII